MRLQAYIFVGLAFLALSSCQEVIELEVDSIEPKVVITADIDATNGLATVNLSQSQDIYEDGAYTLLEGARVDLLLEDSLFSLEEITPGAYALSGLNLLPGQQVQLEVELAEGQLFIASAIVPGQAKLDTVEVEESFGLGNMGTPPGGGSTEPMYGVIVQWNDLPEEANYYRVKLYEEEDFQSDAYLLLDDQLNDGTLISRPLIGQQFSEGTQLRIQLLTTNEGYFRYFTDIANSGGGPGAAASATPYNPRSNFSGDALGYFGVWQTDELFLVVE